MHRLLSCVLLICIATGAEATSCNDPDSYNVPNSVLSVDVKDDNGRIERHWIVHRDEYCHAMKIEVLDTKSTILAYLIYRYDNSGRNARTKLADTTVDTYAPDGSLLFRELADGRRFDAAGNTIDDCAFVKLIGHVDSSLRAHYEQRCHDAS